MYVVHSAYFLVTMAMTGRAVIHIRHTHVCMHAHTHTTVNMYSHRPLTRQLLMVLILSVMLLNSLRLGRQMLTWKEVRLEGLCMLPWLVHHYLSTDSTTYLSCLQLRLGDLLVYLHTQGQLSHSLDVGMFACNPPVQLVHYALQSVLGYKYQRTGIFAMLIVEVKPQNYCTLNHRYYILP